MVPFCSLNVLCSVHPANAFNWVSPILSPCPFGQPRKLGSSRAATLSFDGYDPEYNAETDFLGLVVSSDEPADDVSRPKLLQFLSYTDKLLDMQAREIIRLKAEFSMIKAKCDAESDLRPILLKLVTTDWYIKRYSPAAGTFKPEHAFKAFANLLASTDPVDLDDRIKLENAIDGAVRDGGTANGAVVLRENVEKMLGKMWLKISNVHTFDPGASALCTEEGCFVVSGSAEFSAAVSAIFRFFQVKHAVMSPYYRRMRYSWDNGITQVQDVPNRANFYLKQLKIRKYRGGHL